MKKILVLFICFASSLCYGDAPKPWQLGFQDAVTPVMEQINSFHNLLLWIVFGISIFVFILLGYTCWRFAEKRNPVPSKTTHNTAIEVIWTVIPVLILIVISIPSLRLLYFMDKVDDPEVTLKAIGHQWYWEYDYPEQGVAFDSYMIPDAQIKPGQKRLLEVDNSVVLPVDTNVRILTTSTDVIHSFGVPAFGIKQDSVPGRLAEVWVRVTKPGVYYGQCYELCGMNHGFMPIRVEVVSRADYNKWITARGGKTLDAVAAEKLIVPSLSPTEVVALAPTEMAAAASTSIDVAPAQLTTNDS